jgi:cyclase
VWVEPDRVLFVGDLFGWGLIPLTVNLRPETRERLLATYRRLIDFEAETVIPGHGPMCDTDTLRRWVAYFEDLAARARAAAKQGLDEREIAQRLQPPEDMSDWWRFVQWKHEDTAAKIAKAATRGWL